MIHEQEPRNLVEMRSPRRARDRSITLRDWNDRIRFVFWNWLASTEGDARYETRLAEAMKKLSAGPPSGGTLRRSGRLEIDKLDFVNGDEADRSVAIDRLRTLCALIQPDDTSVVDFAIRLTEPIPTQSVQPGAKPEWWAEIRAPTYQSHLMVVIAATALEAAAGWLSENGDVDPIVRDDHHEWLMRRHLASALLNTATTTNSQSVRAQVMLQRLCPELREDIENFIATSPRWVPCCHVLDRALRIRFQGAQPPHPLVLETASRTALARTADGGYRLLRRLKERPPRGAAALRLVRRVGRVTTSEAERAAAFEMMLHCARDAEQPTRARRFSLWILAEMSRNSPNEKHDVAVAHALIHEMIHDPDYEDVCIVLRDYAGGFESWATIEPNGKVDFYSVEPRTSHGDFIWPMSQREQERLESIILPSRAFADSHDQLFKSPWDRVPRRWVVASREMLVEMLLHPGLVRVKSASDCLTASGAEMRSASARTLAALLREEAESPVLRPHVLECAINNIATFRDDSVLEVLVPFALGDTEVSDPDGEVRAAALVSIGHLLAASERRRDDGGRRPPSAAEAMRALEIGVESSHPVVAQAAVQAVAPLQVLHLHDKLLAVRERFRGRLPEQMATWCLLGWET